MRLQVTSAPIEISFLRMILRQCIIFISRAAMSFRRYDDNLLHFDLLIGAHGLFRLPLPRFLYFLPRIILASRID